MKNKISVVIATYNGERFIQKELETILNQTIPVDEVILGDDGSSDNTKTIIKKFIAENDLENWILIENETNLGLSKNFFNILSKATGDFIFIADQDDEWELDKIEKMIKVMENDSKIMCLTSSFDIIDENSAKIDPPKGLTEIESLNDESFKVTYSNELIGHSKLRGCMMCVRKDLISIILKTDLPNALSMDLLCHDWAISIVATIIGQCVNYNKILCHYRVHGSNTSLENLNRFKMKRKISRRINGLEKSIDAHSELLKLNNLNIELSSTLKNKMIKHVKFEEKRVLFLKNPSLLKYLSLIINVQNYSCYYSSFYQGIKVLIGDLIYVLESRGKGQ